MNKRLKFTGIQWMDVTSLGISQIYLCREKLDDIAKWLNCEEMEEFGPLPVHDFGNGRLTLTDGHSRAFSLYKAGIKSVPVVYDLDEIVMAEMGQMYYKNDIQWCERFRLISVADLETRIIPREQYEKLWIARCDVAYNLLTQTSEEEREKLAEKYSDLFLYGANEDLSILYFEDKRGELYERNRWE